MDIDETKYAIIVNQPSRVGDGLVECSVMIAWIMENIENDWSYNPCLTVIQFCFEKEEDAVAFKLRWI